MRIVIAEDAAVIRAGGPGRDPPTAREHDVLALVAEGRCSGAIADQLVVTHVAAG